MYFMACAGELLWFEFLKVFHIKPDELLHMMHAGLLLSDPNHLF